MYTELLHIFRNTPLGRETFLQSLYFCKTVGVDPVVYIPRHTKFLMYFENDVVQVDLDDSYLTSPDTALPNAGRLLEAAGLEARFLEVKNFTASTLPDVPTQYDFMCLPRSVSDLSSKIGLGYIGPRVRRIVNAARFPVLITSPVYKPWKSIAVLFGGSSNAMKALRLGLRLHRETDLPLKVFTLAEKRTREEYHQAMAEQLSGPSLEKAGENWQFLDGGAVEENLYTIPHDALIVIGAYGHGLIRDIVFGSMMERVQSTLSNNLLVVGPRYVAPA